MDSAWSFAIFEEGNKTNSHLRKDSKTSMS